MRLENTIDKNIEELRIRVLGPSTPALVSMAHWDAGRVSGLLGGAFLTGELPFEARDFLESVTTAWLSNFIRSVSVTDLNAGVTH